VPPGGAYSWHIGPSTRPFVGAIPGRKEAYTLTCEEPGGTVLETLSLVIDRGQGVALNIGCGARPTTLGNRRRVGGDPNAPLLSTAPAINGVAVPVGLATAQAKPKTRAQRLAACNRKAKRIKAGTRRRAALRSCTKRFGKKPAAKEPARRMR